MRRARTSRGLSLMEVLVVMVVLAVLAAIVLTVLSSVRKSHTQAQCASNLHSIGQAFALYSSDFHEYFPVPTPDAQWEDLLRAYVPRATFHCAADSELYASLSSSYDWRDTGNARTTLAGVMSGRVNHPDLSLAFDALPGWHVRGKIQVLRINSSTDLIDTNSFFADMQQSPTDP